MPKKIGNRLEAGSRPLMSRQIKLAKAAAEELESRTLLTSVTAILLNGGAQRAVSSNITVTFDVALKVASVSSRSTITTRPFSAP